MKEIFYAHGPYHLTSLSAASTAGGHKMTIKHPPTKAGYSHHGNCWDSAHLSKLTDLEGFCIIVLLLPEAIESSDLPVRALLVLFLFMIRGLLSMSLSSSIYAPFFLPCCLRASTSDTGIRITRSFLKVLGYKPIRIRYRIVFRCTFSDFATSDIVIHSLCLIRLCIYRLSLINLLLCNNEYNCYFLTSQEVAFKK